MARRHLALSALVSLAATLTAAPAHAAPPEGCIGFPSIPEAFVCITQFSPQNAVPTAGLGPDQTVTIPEFCVFECFGPTPVNVPTVTVTPGSGVLVRVVYDGATHTVAVPTTGSPPDVVALVQQTATSTVASVVGTVNGAAATAQATVAGAEATVRGAVDDAEPRSGVLAIRGEMRINRFGTGATSGTLTGTISGVGGGAVLVEAPVTGVFTYYSDPATCPITGTASGSLTFAGKSWLFNWTMFAEIAVLTVTGSGQSGAGFGTFAVTNPVGNPCGHSNVTGTFTAGLAFLL